MCMFDVSQHRVQGATLEGIDIHILLNAEFFAPGQAYTALSRATSLEQIHLWALDLDAIESRW
jgi:ATP-dependent exoDNAse (exonuclease V) alpha subunit